MSKEDKKRDEEEFADHKEEVKDNDAHQQSEEESLQEALKKAEEESAHWKNEYYKAYADLANLRKDLEKDHAEAIKYRAEGFLDEIIPVLDNFYIALGAKTNSEEAKNYQVGFSYIYNQLVNALVNEGVKEASVKVGDKFDEKFMHAIDTVDSDEEPNKVAAIHQKGYYLKDRLIRPAMVTVTKKAEKKEDKEPVEKEANKA